VRPTSITFPASTSGEPGRTITDPNQLREYINGDVERLRQLRTGLNFKFITGTSSIMDKVLRRANTDKRAKLPPGGDAEAQENAITQATQTGRSGTAVDIIKQEQDGRRYVTDSQGNRIYEDANPIGFNQAAEAAADNLQEIQERATNASPGSSAVGTFFRSVGKGLLITGSLDTACTVFNTLRAAQAAAKAKALYDFIAYSMSITPDIQKLKAGEGTPEVATFLGNKFSYADPNKKIIDESSIVGVDGSGNPVYEERDNPDYCKTGFDDRSVRLAATNLPIDAQSPLTAREQQSLVGGGLVGTLSGVMDTIASTLGVGNTIEGHQRIRGICSVIQSWWVRTLGLVAGLFSAAGSFGASTAISIGASTAIGFALPFLQSMLADTLAGTKVDGKTKGLDAVRSLFVGTSGLFGEVAKGSGMMPSNKQRQRDYELVGQEVRESYIATETLEAKKAPFDVYNEHSFLGSFARSITFPVIKSSSTVSGALVAIPSVIGTAFTSLMPNSYAKTFNEARYNHCTTDVGYQELGIDADIYCNVRYSMTKEQLAIDPLDSAIWMEDNGHIEPNGTPKSDSYKRWVESCVERTAGWGETEEEEPADYDAAIGKICTEITDEHNQFVVFTFSNQLEDAMSNQPVQGGSSANAFLYNPYDTQQTHVAGGTP
jgi:hypothetical protein